MRLSQMDSILVCICARNFHDGLLPLLHALGIQARQINQLTRLCIVANTSEPPHVLQFKKLEEQWDDATVPLLVEFEPRVGIPHARNHALDVANQVGANLLAFIDDDCWPEDGWLAGLLAARSREKADVVAGGWILEPKTTPSAFLPPYVFGQKWYEVGGKSVANGGLLHTCYTRSVIFDVSPSSLVVSSSIRFDPSRIELGGSDVIFFRSLFLEGARIIYSEDSLVREYFAGNRVTLRWWFWRRFRNAQFRIERGELTFGDVLRGLRKTLSTFLVYVAGALLPFLRKKGGTPLQAIGHIALSLAPFFGSIAMGRFRYKSYPTSK
jgi:glycosyltransferase involved in cell wall biosynthesis